MRFIILTLIWGVVSVFSMGQSDETLLMLNTPIEGQIVDTDEADTWRFYAFKDDVLTFSLEGQGFDPILTIQDTNGIVISNDDFDYPDNEDALLEAITIPRTGDYEVVVTGFNGATGDYQLLMLPGYADLVADERFVSMGDWQITDDFEAVIDNGMLTLSLVGVANRAYVSNPAYADLDDFYAMLDVNLISGNAGWSIGFSLDQYVVLVNSQGFWRVILLIDDGEVVLRDWIPHPAIMAGEGQFSLSIIKHGQGLEVFYNRKLLGQVNHVGLTSTAGLQLVVETANAVGSEVKAVFDNLIITVPRLVNGQTIFPQQIVSADAYVVAEELERRHVVPSGGFLAWQIEESFAGTYQPGVNRVPLVRGGIYDNFVMGATFVLDVVEPIVGCGLLFQSVDNTSYMIAYLDNTGAYGVSRRQDTSFTQGLYGELEDINTTQPNRLVIIVYDGVLHYYINGHYRGTLDVEPVAGEAGNVVINFDPVESSCEFNDTWLWTWESQ